MQIKNMMLGVYNDPDVIYNATKKLIKSGYQVRDVYSPFAIHGIDRVMGIKRSRLSIVAFCFALFGITSAITLMSYTGYFDWQVNVGGKPALHLPTFIPITFELGVLCTAFGLVGCFFIVNKLAWGKNADIIDIKVTDDLFVVAIDLIDHKTDEEELSSLLKNTGAIEIRKRGVDV